MSPRRWLGAWLVCAPLVPALATAQDRTAEELVDLIVRDGPHAHAIRTGADVVRREQDARLAWPNPGVGYSREGAGFAEFLQVSQLLPVFGTRTALLRAGVAATEAAEADRDARLWQLRANAMGAVARFVADQARVELARSTVAQIDTLIEILRTREREGEGARFDRLRAEQELAEARQLAAMADVSAAESRASLAALLPSGVTLAGVSGPSFAPREIPSPEMLLARATKSRRDLQALERTSEQFVREADAARRARLPVPTVTGGMKRADDRDGRATAGVLGITVAFPLFDSGARDAARWQAERTRVDADRTVLQRDISGHITGAAVSADLRQRALAAAEAAATGAEDLIGIVDVAYRDGEVGILEVLDARRTATRARQRVLDARLDARLAQIALIRAVGDSIWP